MIKKSITWGIAGPWYWEFQNRDADPLLSQLRFIVEQKLDTCSIGLNQLAELPDDRKKVLRSFQKEHGLRYVPHIGFDFLRTPESEVQKIVDGLLKKLEAHLEFFEGTITTTGLGAGHRFDRALPLEEKLAKCSKSLTPLTRGVADLGLPLGIENHGDYYVSDLVRLCQQTPYLYLFLDTGNTYLIGEAPLPAFELAAPYTIGTHFKDHFVGPNHKDLKFEITGAPIGAGDVPMRECYDILMKNSPHKNHLVMMLEMISPKDMNPMECMQQSLKFIRSL